MNYSTTRLGNIQSGGYGHPVSWGTVADADEYLNDQAYSLTTEGWSVLDHRPSRPCLDVSRGTTWMKIETITVIEEEGNESLYYGQTGNYYDSPRGL